MVEPPVLHVTVLEVNTNVDADEPISRVHGAGYMGTTMAHKREHKVQRLQPKSSHSTAPLPSGVATERGTVVQAGHASGLQDVSQKKSDWVSRRHRPDDVAVYIHQVRSDIKSDITPRGLVRMVAPDIDGVVWVQREVIGRIHGRLAGCGGAAVAKDLFLFNRGDYKQLTGTRDKNFLRNHVPAPDVIVVPELAEVWDHHTTTGVRPAQRTVCARGTHNRKTRSCHNSWAQWAACEHSKSRQGLVTSVTSRMCATTAERTGRLPPRQTRLEHPAVSLCAYMTVHPAMRRCCSPARWPARGGSRCPTSGYSSPRSVHCCTTGTSHKALHHTSAP